MIHAGIDAGSRTIKIVLLDEKKNIVASGRVDQGVKQTELALRLMDETLEKADQTRDSVTRIVATGYGRDALDFADVVITEITCHARGVRHLNPEARTIVDIGGQDSKLIRLDAAGKVRDFVMNDRCAAGTGRFLELVSERLEITLDELGTHAERAVRPSVISNMCAVFAETEITGLMAQGESRENIVAGVQKAIASRTAAMAGSRIETPVVLTGGVALISGMDTALAEALNQEIYVSSLPIFTGALGAALSAEDFS